MRLFIAIPLSEKMKQSVADTQGAFRFRGVRGNYTPEENLHVTLAFIGEYGDPNAVLDALETSFGNPSSAHYRGFEAEKIMREARQTIAGTLKCQEKEIFFT